MRPDPEVHDALANLLAYPGDGGWKHQEAAIAVVAGACPEARVPLASFAAAIGELTPGEREELYTRTFDSTDDRSLEVGWQLFGEQYARGALMVRLRQLLREHKVAERTELPDHLTHVLPLVGRASDQLASALVECQIVPALEKMLTGLREIESPYVGVLEATRAVLAMHVPAVERKEANAR